MNFRSEAERGVCARNLFKVEKIFLLRLRPVTRFSKVPGTYRQIKVVMFDRLGLELRPEVQAFTLWV